MDRTPSSARIFAVALLTAAACADDLAVDGGSTSSSSEVEGSTGLAATADADSTASMPGSEDTTGTAAPDPGTSSSGPPPDSTGTGGEDSSSTSPGTTLGSSSGSSTTSTGSDPVCGDGVVEGTETCDGEALEGAMCPVFGEVSCAEDCTLELSGCDDALVVCSTPDAALGALQTASMPLVDVIDVDEDFFVVDLEVTVDITHSWVGDLNASLAAPVSDASSVLFASPCGPAENIDARFDDEGAMPVCGNFPALSGDVIPVTELRDLVGVSSQGQWSLRAFDDAPFANDGTLNGWCLELTLSAEDPVVCGDGVANYGEVCDGDDVEPDCTSLDAGFVAGAVSCADDCTLDTSACVPAGCGNGVLEVPEACDGAALGDASCSDFEGLDGAGLSCADDCTFDTSGCDVVSCGDGVIGGAEACDSAALGGAVCEDFPGYASGTLTCLADCTGFDLSGCVFDFVEVCSSPEAPISDLLGPTVDAVAFVEPGTVADVDVFVDITHSWVGDLQLDLASPEGTTVVVFDGCEDVDDLQALFDDEGDPLSCGGMPGVSGSVIPSQPLSAFDGETIAGAWTLSVTDDAPGDNGALNTWCVQITPEGG